MTNTHCNQSWKQPWSTAKEQQCSTVSGDCPVTPGRSRQCWRDSSSPGVLCSMLTDSMHVKYPAMSTNGKWGDDGRVQVPRARLTLYLPYTWQFGIYKCYVLKIQNTKCQSTSRGTSFYPRIKQTLQTPADGLSRDETVFLDTSDAAWVTPVIPLTVPR